MATIDFKNVGTRITDVRRQHDSAQRATIPFGFKTPLSLSDSATHPFAMHYNIANQIHDNLKNLLLTNWGERVGLFTFGANLRPLLFEYAASGQFDAEAAIRIKTAVERYMPYVDLVGFSSSIETRAGDTLGSVSLTVTYNIAQLNIVNRALTLIFYIGG